MEAEKTKTKNLADGLFDEMNRVRELIKMYTELPGGVGTFGAAVMTLAIKKAEEAIASGDVVEMLGSYQSLSECE